MSNQWYEKTVNEIGLNNVDLGNLNDPKVVLLQQGLYTFSQSHEFLSDIPAGSRMSTVTLVNYTFGVSGEAWIDADDFSFLSPPVATAFAMVVYDDSGTESTSPLLFFIDQADNLPITTLSGKDLDMAINSSGLARL